MDSFKKEFKRYKQRKPPPDLSQVIDLQTPEKFKEKVFPVSAGPLDSHETFSSVGLKHCADWKVYSIKDCPGFIFITNPFLKDFQWEWAKRCIKGYSCKPNVSNLDAHMEIKDSIWNMSVNGFDKESPIYRLRWVTLGYHYNWDTKTYREDVHSEFPPDLAMLFVTIANALGFQNFSPEAGIINYYHLDSTLGGHTDHSEFDLTAPLFSISLGQSVIFLLGGETRDVAPVAMHMRSGDIMIMAGKSRLAYHGVPRVLAPSEDELIPECLEPCSAGISRSSCENSEFSMRSKESTRDLHCGDNMEGEVLSKRTKFSDSTRKGNQSDFHVPEENTESSALKATETELIKQYLSTSRININIRQVLGSGKTFPGTQFLNNN